MHIPSLRTIYADTSRGLGGRLVCGTCGRVQSCSEHDAAGYLARGWPTCCGYTMTLETKGMREAAKVERDSPP